MESGSKVCVKASAYLWLCILLLTLPFCWVVSALFAALVHEMCHIITLWLLGIPVFRCSIGISGASLETGGMSLREELLCALAGPAGSLFLLIFSRYYPRIALCGLIQGVYNLIPLGNLDGGRVLRCLIALVFGKKPCKQGKEGVQ